MRIRTMAILIGAALLLPACASEQDRMTPLVSFPGTLVVRWEDGIYAVRAGEADPTKTADVGLGTFIVATSPDGTRVVTGDGLLIEVATGKTTQLEVGRIGEAAFSPDGRRLASLGRDPWVLAITNLVKGGSRKLGRGQCADYQGVTTPDIETLCTSAQGLAWLDDRTLVYAYQTTLPSTATGYGTGYAAGGPDRLAVVGRGGRVVREMDDALDDLGNQLIVRSIEGGTVLFTDGSWAKVEDLRSGRIHRRMIPGATSEYGDPTAWLLPDGDRALVAGEPWSLVTLDTMASQVLGTSHEMVEHHGTAWSPEGSMFACADTGEHAIVGVPLSQEPGGTLIGWAEGGWGEGGVELLAWVT